MKKYIYFIAAAVLSAGCSTDGLEKFDSGHYLYFDRDALSYTFAYNDESVRSVTFDIPVSMAGRFLPSERGFTVAVVDTATTASPGVDFVLPDKPTLGAGASGTSLRVELNRTAVLAEKDLVITLCIVPDGNFRPGHIPVVTLTVSDRVIKPNWWEYAPHDTNLGTYTPTKLLLWFEFTNVHDGSDPWDDPEYYYMTDRGTGNFIYKEYKSGVIRSNVISFRGWLRTQKGDPMDPDAGKPVSETLGEQI